MRWALPGALLPMLLLGACHASNTDIAETPGVIRVGLPQKVFQLLGDVDWQTRPPLPVPGQTLTRYGVVGADLGYPVSFQGKTLFLFADVVGTDDTVTNQFADAVGWTTSLSPGPFAIDFFPPGGGSLPFLPLTVNGLALGADDGPSSAFVVGDNLYGFMRVGATPTAIDPVTGQAAGSAKGFLAVSHDGGMTFSALFDLPSPMVATQQAVVATSSVPGVGWTAPQTLLVWGHDKGPPVLAAAPLDGLADGGWSGTWRWWTGSGWSAQPSDADGVYAPDDRCGGNFSVTYVQGMAKWLMTLRCPAAPISVVHFRVADSPLGPWSAAQVWFDAVADRGYCHFIHQGCDGGASCCDQDITGYFAGGAASNTGFPYGPYVIPQLGTWDSASSTATFYSLMSTGNPYTPVLMQTQLRVSGGM